MVVLGQATTLGVTLDAMVHHTTAVSRAASRALVVADMPFLTCHTGVPEAIRAAGRLVSEGGAKAVKVEGGFQVLEVVQRLGEAGIPVMGHLGLTPQSIHQIGGFRKQARRPEDAGKLLESASALEAAGACAVVLEAIPARVAARVTNVLEIPTIGIGAGPHCDGQVLVSHDAFGLYEEFTPPFVKRFANLGEQMAEAARAYVREVREGDYPATAEPELARHAAD